MLKNLKYVKYVKGKWTTCINSCGIWAKEHTYTQEKNKQKYKKYKIHYEMNNIFSGFNIRLEIPVEKITELE